MSRVFKQKVLVLVWVTFFLLNGISSTSATVPDVHDMGYYLGDAHVHTRIGGDAPWVDLADQVADAKRKGLNWLQLTEHSDLVLFNFFRKDYLTDEEWYQIITDTNLDWSIPILPGEEVTVGNGRNLDTLGHFLAYGITHKVEPYQVMGERRRTSSEVVNTIENDGGFGYIAHPYGSGKPIFDAPTWRDWSVVENYPNTVKGLEIITGGYTSARTLNRWDKYLLQGKKVFGIANSDSHGTGIGSSFTYLYTGGTLAKSGIKEALRKGHAIFSNGPFVTFSTNKGGIPGDEVKASVGETLTLNIQWVTTPEQGYPWEVQLFDDTVLFG